MLKRIVAFTNLLLYLLLPFFNIQMMNVFYPNFLGTNHTALLGISILFILNIVLTISEFQKVYKFLFLLN